MDDLKVSKEDDVMTCLKLRLCSYIMNHKSSHITSHNL